MTQWWHKLSKRERLLLAIAGLVLSSFILLQLIIAPALKARTLKKIDVARSAQTLDIIGTRSDTNEGLSGSTANTFRENLDPDSFRRTVLDTATNRGLIISRVQMTDDGKVTVQLEDTPAQAVFAWLFDLKRTIGVETSRATMSDVGDNLVRSSFEFGGDSKE